MVVQLYRTLRGGVRHVLASEQGARGLYVGMWPTLVGIMPYMALNFTFYEGLKRARLVRPSASCVALTARVL